MNFEGYSLRLAMIAALILGAIYVLLPTFLIDEAAEVAAQTEQVDTNDGAALNLKVMVQVDGDPAAAAAALSDRLAAADVAVKQVKAGDGAVDVIMKAGTARDDIVAAVAHKGVTTYFVESPLEGDAPPPASDAEVKTVDGILATLDPSLRRAAVPAIGDDLRLAERVATLGGAAPPAFLSPMVEVFGTPQEGEIGIAPGVPVDDLSVVFVAGDDKIIGIGVPTTSDAGTYLAFHAYDPAHPLIPMLSTPLDQTYTVDIPTDEASATEQEPVALTAGQALPPEVLAMLPNTRLNLGIDLRGGIDLTLQVDLEEAVIGRVHRDKASLIADIDRDFGGDGVSDEFQEASGFLVSCQKAIQQGGNGETIALDEGWKQAVIKADRDLAIITVQTELTLADVQSYLIRRLGDYSYQETVTTEEGATKHVFEMSDEAQKRIADEAVEQVLETLRRRIDATGVKEPSIVKKGGGAISVQLPGMVDLQSAVNAIGTTAVLEFQLVEQELTTHLSKVGMIPTPVETMLQDARRQMPADQFLNDDLLDRWLHDNRKLPDDRILRWQYTFDDDGTEFRQSPPHVLKLDPNPLTGSDVSDAGVGWGQAQEALVLLSFKARGSNKFCKLTSANVNKRFAIMLDNKVMSAPTIRSEICGGRAQIEMGGGLDPTQESQDLALVLRTGSLNAPVSVGEVRIVGSTLGEDSIRAGGIATAIGAGLVLIFMGLWYRTSGMVANFALAANVLLVLASLCLFGANLTLPGIAGIALTVGMAVDANIIIYERIREEMRLGQSARKSVDVGFEKATVAVLDANITTAIAGVVLFSYGTGPIKGFAVTLLVGIGTTLITALFINRTLMEILTRNSTARLKI